MPEDIPVGAPVSLEFITTIDSCALYTHKDRRFTESINIDTTRAQLFCIYVYYIIFHIHTQIGCYVLLLN